MYNTRYLGIGTKETKPKPFPVGSGINRHAALAVSRVILENELETVQVPARQVHRKKGAAAERADEHHPNDLSSQIERRPVVQRSLLLRVTHRVNVSPLCETDVGRCRRRAHPIDIFASKANARVPSSLFEVLRRIYEIIR